MKHIPYVVVMTSYLRWTVDQDLVEQNEGLEGHLRLMDS